MLELAATSAHDQIINLIPILVGGLVTLILPTFIIITIAVVVIGMLVIGKYFMTKYVDFIDRMYQ